jgi:hypothetical protein
MVRNKKLQRALLWAGSFPCMFGYFLYMRFGHLSHHNGVGGHSMAALFSSDKEHFEVHLAFLGSLRRAAFSHLTGACRGRTEMCFS